MSFKNIPGFGNYYQVDENGNIKSISRIIPHQRLGQKRVNERILKQRIDRNGYHLATLAYMGDAFVKMVHVLVALAHIPNPFKKPFINHKDGNKSNNNISNLEWCTQSENTLHAFKNGLMVMPRGEKNHSSKLTEKEVVEIKSLLSKGEITQYKIAKLFKVHKVTIFDIKHGKTWTHI